MKYLILCSLLFGAAFAAEDDIEIEERTLNLTETVSSINDVINALTGNTLGLNETKITETLEAFGLNGDSGATGAAATAAAVVTAISAVKTAALALIAGPLTIANQILSVIGLVLLIVFLVDGGDFLSLVGLSDQDFAFRSLPSSWSFSDVINNRMINNLSDMVYKAIEKYD